MLRIILTAISLFFIVGCGDPFPSNKVYFVDAKKQKCIEYDVDTDSVKLANGKFISIDQCPQVTGFNNDDIGKVTAWIRRNKKKLEECQ